MTRKTRGQVLLIIILITRWILVVSSDLLIKLGLFILNLFYYTLLTNVVKSFKGGVKLILINVAMNY